MSFSKLCLTVENNLPLRLCSDIIDLYENHSKLQERYDNNGTPNFTQLNLTQYFSEYAIHKEICSYILNAVSLYNNKINGVRLPTIYSYEQIRIKKYNNDGKDLFDWHTDSTNIKTCKRFLALFWYLNTVQEGGSTDFIAFDENWSIKAEVGKLVVFPPNWIYFHKGNPPISNEKYLLSTYLHYC